MSALKPEKHKNVRQCKSGGNLSLRSMDRVMGSRWQPRGGSSEPTWAPSVRTLQGTIPPHCWEGGLRPGAEWEVAASSWDGGRGTTCPACWSLAAPLHRPAHLLAPPWHQGARMQVAREDNVRWGRRCADNQLKTFRTQEVSFAHNKSNWSPAHKPCQIASSFDGQTRFKN